MVVALLLIGLAAAGPATALDPEKSINQYVFDNWATENGLPQSTVLTSLQDQDGFLWFGTQNGLARFNGQSFLVFRRRDHEGLSSDFIQALALDQDGALWIGTGVGLSRLAEGRFSKVPDNQPGSVHAIVDHPQRGILVASESGLYRVSQSRSPTIELIDDTPTFSLYVDADQTLWSGHDGMIRRHQPGGAFQERSLANTSTARVRSMLHYQGQLWLGTSDGLRIADDTGGFRRPQDQPEALTDLLVEALLVDADQQLWIGSEVGLYRYHDGRFELDNSQLENAQIRSFLEDHENNLWVGTTSRGVARFWSGKLRQYGLAHGLESPMVWGVAESPDGVVWAFSRVGIYQFDGQQFHRRYQEQLPHPTALSGYWDAFGRQWIATAGGLSVFRDGELIDLPQLAEFPHERIYSVREFTPGEQWISTSRYLYRATATGLDQVGPAQGLTERIVRDTHIDNDGVLWIATDGGLFRGNPEQVERVEDPALGNGMIATMAAHGDSIWMGLQGYGVARYRDGEFRNYSTTDGLHSDVVFYILRDPMDRLWFSGPEGLSITPAQQFEQLDDGEIERLSPNVIGADWDQQRAQVNGGHAAAGLAASDGNFYFPTLNGLLQVDPTSSQMNEIPPPVQITRLSSRDVEWENHRNHAEALTLPAGSRNLEIHYAGLSFQNTERVRYRYRLVGVDDGWVDAGNRTLAIYTNLRPGNYRFEVEAANNDGIWSRQPASLEWRIEAFFYQTTWFLALAVMAAIALLVGLFHWRLRKVEQQRRLLRQMVEQRTQELAEANRQLEQASLTDALTELRNRRFLTSHIEQDVAMVRRAYTARSLHPNRDLLFVMVDLDHFKQINDEHGHVVGDQILKQMAERLMSAIRESDYAIRWGGEEFLIVARHSERSQAHIVAERIRAAIADHPFDTNDGPLPCTASVGYANYPFSPAEAEAVHWEAVIDIADMALYRAKQQGRNRWVGLECNPETPAQLAFEEARRDIEQALQEKRLHQRDAQSNS